MKDKEENLMEELRALLSDPFSVLRIVGKKAKLSNAVTSLQIVDDGDGNRYIHVENYPIYIPFDTGCEALYERKLRVGVP